MLRSRPAVPFSFAFGRHWVYAGVGTGLIDGLSLGWRNETFGRLTFFGGTRAFLGRVEEKAVGIDRIRGVSPGQHVVKIVHEELVGILGETNRGLSFADEVPPIVLLVGLQGSGKTTSAAKLARLLDDGGKHPFLVAADIYRPAAVEQLRVLAERAGVPVYAGADGDGVPDVVAAGVAAARVAGAEAVSSDWAGRGHCVAGAGGRGGAYRFREHRGNFAADRRGGAAGARVGPRWSVPASCGSGRG